jgi:biopolymer transport protein TolR
VRNRRDDLPLTADINVTSLVDVAFTLLVIFIITAPVLQGGIELEPPEADVPPLTAEDEPFFVSVTSDGTVYVEETPLADDEFRSALPRLLGMASPDRVYLRGDAVAQWERMVQVMGILKDAGTPWVIVAQPWPEG